MKYFVIIGVLSLFLIGSLVGKPSTVNHDKFVMKGAPEMTWNEYKEIRSAGEGWLKKLASKKCADNADVVPFEMRNDYYLIAIAPDFKICITDPAFMVLKKTGKTFGLVFFGTCCLENTPWADDINF